MNWKLILQLSLFGLAMGLATVFFIPSKVEPIFWLLIFIFCAYIIAKKQTGKYFVHGLMTSIMNSVWITAAHLMFFDQYLTHHMEEALMMAHSPIEPKLLMLLTGPVIGIVSGLILGLFAFIASKIVKKKV